METRGIEYLYKAWSYLVGNLTYVIIPVLLTSCLYLAKFIEQGLDFYYIVGIYLSIAAIVPLLYGQFIEIITTGNKENWKIVFEKYWIKVFIVSLILKVPFIIIDFIFPQTSIFESILSLGLDVLTIYVLPLVLLSNSIFSSIEIGIKCLIGNFKFSAPFIVVIVLFPVLSSVITKLVKHFDTQFVLYSSSIFIIFLSTFVNFLIFISAAMVLKEKLLKMKDV